MTFSKLISLCAIVLIQLQSVAQINFSGTDFWINSCDENSILPIYNIVRVMGDVATVGNVSVPGTGFSEDFCFNAGGEYVDIGIPLGSFGITTSNVVENTAIHITADNNVMVVMFPWAGADSDYYTAIPTAEVGQEYYVNMAKGVGFWWPSLTQITATQNNTTVTVSNSNAELGPYTWGIGNDIAMGSSTVFVLNLGESVRFESGQDDSTAPSSVLQHSGTRITADKPVFVSSSNSSNLPSLSVLHTDEMRETLLPKSTWGDRHFTATWNNPEYYQVQVVSADNANTIFLDGTAVATLNEFEMFDTILAGAREITSTFDVGIVQFSMSKDYNPVIKGDPSSFNVLSESNFVTTFHDINATYGPANSVDSIIYMLTVPTSAIPSTTINGTAIPPAQFTPIGATGYSNGIVETTAPSGTHEFLTFNSSQPMMVYKVGLPSSSDVTDAWQLARNLGTLNNVPNSNVYDASCNLVILPVDFIDFTAEQTLDYNLLQWSTQSEKNNDYFLIERSSNSVDFATIGRIEGVGTTTQLSNYVFNDTAPILGLQYYRLKQVDSDGAFSYSKIIALERTNQNRLNLYPNPVVETLEISVNSDKVGAANISVFDISGKLLIDQIADDFSSVVHLDVMSLQSGSYVVEVIQNGVSMRERFTKK